jgi:hypothetical protein
MRKTKTMSQVEPSSPSSLTPAQQAWRRLALPLLAVVAALVFIVLALSLIHN